MNISEILSDATTSSVWGNSSKVLHDSDDNSHDNTTLAYLNSWTKDSGFSRGDIAVQNETDIATILSIMHSTGVSNETWNVSSIEYLSTTGSRFWDAVTDNISSVSGVLGQAFTMENSVTESFLPSVNSSGLWSSTSNHDTSSLLDLATQSTLLWNTSTDGYNADLFPEDALDLPVQNCVYFQFMLRVVMVLVFLLCGLLSNLLVIWVYWSDCSHPVPLLITLISCVDCIFLVGVSVQMIGPGIRSLFPNVPGLAYYMGHVQPVLVTYIRAVIGLIHLSNTWYIVLVTLYRYIAVCHPLKQETFKSTVKTKLQIVTILGLSGLYYIPVFAQFYPQPNPSGDGFRIRSRPFAKGLFELLYYSIFYYTILYIIPFTMLITMTTRIVLALRRLRKKKETMTKKKQDDFDTTRMLLVVAGFFMLLQLPVPTIRFIRTALNLVGDGPCASWTAYYFSFARILLCLNASINGLIYYAFSKSFRGKAKAKLCRSNKVNDVSTTATTVA